MKSLKPHIAPVLHNAVGSLIAAGILGCLLVIKSIRDFAVPFWIVLILFVLCVVTIVVLFKKKNQKQTGAIAALTKQHSETHVKDQKTIERLTAANTQKDKEITALKARVSEVEREIAPYRERFSSERMFKGFHDDPKPKQ